MLTSALLLLIRLLSSLPSREVAQIDQFLQETAAREANAKVRLQQFIEELLDRADRAEKQLQIISSCGTTPNGSLGRCSLQASKGNGRQVRTPSSAFPAQRWISSQITPQRCVRGNKYNALFFSCLFFFLTELE